MTKRHVFPFGTCRHYIPNLHRLIPDNDAVDQQLYQLPSLLEIEVFERVCYPSTKLLNPGGVNAGVELTRIADQN